VGDHAIWLGERAVLRRLGIRVDAAFAVSRAGVDAIRRASQGRTVLIHGGGNVGDTWPMVQELWEALASSLRDRRVVLLPQTVYFRDPRALERARRAFEGHPDLTLMVRDRRSLDLVRERFAVRVVLCPDMALALGPLRRRVGGEGAPIVWVCRRDREGRAERTPVDGIEPHDWWDPVPVPPHLRLRGSIALRTARIIAERAGAVPGRVVLGAFDEASRYRLARGIRLLGRGRVVVTDRLHGHILSLLLGIPHVLLDNSYGKNRAFYETWTAASPLVRWASTPREAIAIARAWPPRPL